MVTREQWEIGQVKEREHHILSFDEGRKHYANAYAHYFRYLDIHQHLDERDIIEVGSADFPALDYCYDLGNCYVIEPMPSEILTKICNNNEITLISKPAEEVDFPKVSEVWFLNVLQHVLDPDLIIDKAKASAKIIRFFEPIEAGTDAMHHHNFTMDWFRDRFGGCVKYFEPNQGIEGFHTWQNAYGVYEV